LPKIINIIAANSSPYYRIWGEIIKKKGVLMVLAVAVTMLTVHVMAQGTAGYGSVDILGTDGGIFETDGAAFSFPEFQDTSINTVTVGDDRALAFGNIWQKSPVTTATNNLEIKQNQDSGECFCCPNEIDNASPCQDCCIKVNLEHISVGKREALAFGSAAATNNIKIVTNQQ